MKRHIIKNLLFIAFMALLPSLCFGLTTEEQKQHATFIENQNFAKSYIQNLTIDALEQCGKEAEAELKSRAKELHWYSLLSTMKSIMKNCLIDKLTLTIKNKDKIFRGFDENRVKLILELIAIEIKKISSCNYQRT